MRIKIEYAAAPASPIVPAAPFAACRFVPFLHLSPLYLQLTANR